MPEPSALALFQDDFLRALDGETSALAQWLAPDTSDAGLAVYRNTVAKGAVDALIANYPAVARLTGEDWMAAAAATFARAHRPRTPALIAYGEGFPEWLATFAPARDLPYLPGVASLDRLWTEAHLAADAEPLDAAALASLSSEELQSTSAALHPAVRFAWFENNTPALWCAQRETGAPEALAWEPRPEGVLLARPCGAVVPVPITAGGYAFLDACRTALPLAAAAEAALVAEPAIDLPDLVARLLQNGVLAALIRMETVT